MPQLLPRLYFLHRGYFLVVMALLALHAVSVADEWGPQARPRHAAPAFAIHNTMAPHWLWGLGHLVICMAILVGLYNRGGLLPVRLASAASISMFGVNAGSYLWAIVTGWPHVSYNGVALSLFVIVVSVAALLEPGVNPASVRIETP